jgi:hypothetical protein
VLPTVERGLREIIAVDRRFDPHAFLEGARGAYGIVLGAFWRGDKDELAKLCDADVATGFAAAIDERNAAGEVVDNRLVRLNEVVITARPMPLPMPASRCASWPTSPRSPAMPKAIWWPVRCMTPWKPATPGPSAATSTPPIPTGCSTRPMKVKVGS